MEKSFEDLGNLVPVETDRAEQLIEGLPSTAPTNHEYVKRNLRPLTGRKRPSDNGDSIKPTTQGGFQNQARDDDKNLFDVENPNDPPINVLSSIAPANHDYVNRNLRPLTGKKRPSKEDDWRKPELPSINSEHQPQKVNVSTGQRKKALRIAVPIILTAIILVTLAVILPILLQSNESNENACSNVLVSRIVELPEGCTFNGKNSIDKGKCMASNCSSDSYYCCGPTSYDTVFAQCTNSTITILVAKACKCSKCDPPTKYVSGVVTGSDGLYLNNGLILINGSTIGNTDANGNFIFSVPYSTQRLVIVFKDTKEQKYLDAIQVFEFPSGETYVHLNIKMLKFSVNITLDSSNVNHVSLQGNSNMTPIANVSIPANAFYTEDGNLYMGSVIAYIGVIDPNDLDTFTYMPGDLTTVDQYGVEQPLESYGMFGFQFKTQDGHNLHIPGSITVEIAQNQLGSNEGNSPVKLWRMNVINGRWELEDDINIHKRKKRSHNGASSTIYGIPYTYQWFNFDAIRNSACYSKIRVYKTNDFDEKHQVEGIKVSVIIHGSGTSLSRYRASTDNGDTNGYCILHPCKSPRDPTNVNTYKAYIFAEKDGKPLIPPNNTQSGFTSTMIQNLGYEAQTDKISVGKVDLSIASNGPFYDYTGTGGKGWAESQTCSDAPVTDNHFRFSSPVCYKAYDTVEYGVSDKGQCIERYYLLWYSILSHETSVGFVAAFIKIYIPGGYNGKLKAHTLVKNIRSNEIPAITDFGYREDCFEEGQEVLCLEVKLPNEIGCSIRPTHIVGETETVLSMQSPVNYVISEVNPKLTQDVQQPASNSQLKLSLRFDNYGATYGIYTYKHDSVDYAVMKAKKNCYAGNEITGSSTKVTNEGWAIKINATCSSLDLVFVLDSSGSMSYYLSDIKTFLTELVSLFSTDIFSGSVKIAFVTFHPSEPIKWKLNDPMASNVTAIKNYFDTIFHDHDYDYTFPYLALNTTYNNVIKKPGNCINATNVIIYISDGYESTSNFNVLLPLMKKTIRFVPVGTRGAHSAHFSLFGAYLYNLNEYQQIYNELKKFVY